MKAIIKIIKIAMPVLLATAIVIQNAGHRQREKKLIKIANDEQAELVLVTSSLNRMCDLNEKLLKEKANAWGINSR